MAESDKLMVFTPRVTPRTEYIFSLLIRDLAGAELVFAGSRDEYDSYGGPRIEYASEPSGQGIFFQCYGLLSENTVGPQELVFSTFRDYPAFFQVADGRSSFPFDPFSAAFYLVTRYEEYLSYKPDRYGRFMASDSAANAGNFLSLPLVNIWAEMVRDTIRQNWPGFRFRGKEFRFVPTIDIDHAYAYRKRSLIRTAGGYARSFGSGNFREVMRRTWVLAGLQKDPYDSFDYLEEVHDRMGYRPFYFVLLASYGKDDNNVSVSSSGFRDLLRRIDRDHTLGIHPSLTSNRHPHALEREVTELSRILRRDVTRSRQHFLKTSFPETFNRLLELGITDDYSLGYAAEPGFRAGIADPFLFFDLQANRVTSLTLHPVTLMDVTLKNYCGYSPEEAIGILRSYCDAIKAVRGEFVTIWHNESFDEGGKWKGWPRVYEALLEYCRKESAS